MAESLHVDVGDAASVEAMVGAAAERWVGSTDPGAFAGKNERQGASNASPRSSDVRTSYIFRTAKATLV